MIEQIAIAGIGECECGCGKLVKGWNSHTKKPIRFLQGHHIKAGIIKPNYKGGIIFDGRYLKKMVPNHPFANSMGYVYLHRLIYEEYYNCILPTWVDVHHIDDNPLNNDINNLMPCYRSQHNILRQGKWHQPESGRLRISQSNKGKKFSEEHRIKISESKKSWWNKRKVGEKLK